MIGSDHDNKRRNYHLIKSSSIYLKNEIIVKYGSTCCKKGGN